MQRMLVFVPQTYNTHHAGGRDLCDLEVSGTPSKPTPYSVIDEACTCTEITRATDILHGVFVFVSVRRVRPENQTDMARVAVTVSDRRVGSCTMLGTAGPRSPLARGRKGGREGGREPGREGAREGD